MSTTIRYHVRHETRYRYDHPVGESHQLLRLAPRNLAWQTTVAHKIVVNPEPARFTDYTDSFGNLVRALHFEADHDALTVHSESWVELQPRRYLLPRR